jgi:uncharacterized protein
MKNKNFTDKFNFRFYLLPISLILLICFNINFLYGQDIPDKPNPSRLVNDYVGILKENEKQKLENKLVAFDDSTSNQIAIVIVNDLAGLDKADYAFRIGEKWGIGQKDKNNGIVILVKPSGQKGQRGAFIAVGYGLEPVIPDAIAKRIVENEMIPYFKEGQFYQGLDKATSILISLAKKEFSAAQYIKKSKSKEPSWLIKLIPLFIIFIIIIIINLTAHSNRNLNSKGSNSLGFWTSLFLLSSMGNRRGGGFNDFTSGSNSFGGFGGGSFGGGGAGGSW